MLRKFLSIIMTLSSLLFSLSGMAENIPFGGIKKMQFPNKMELSVATEKDFDFVDEQGTRRYWKTTLTLKKEKRFFGKKLTVKIKKRDGFMAISCLFEKESTLMI